MNKYKITARIIIKSFAKSGKVKTDFQECTVNENDLGNELNQYLALKLLNGWEDITFEVRLL